MKNKNVSNICKIFKIFKQFYLLSTPIGFRRDGKTGLDKAPGAEHRRLETAATVVFDQLRQPGLVGRTRRRRWADSVV